MGKFGRIINAGIGEVALWPTETPPANGLECDGSAVSRSTYSELFAKIGETYGVGDGSTTFNLPDYRGQFVRGWDHGAGTDPDAATRTDRGDGTIGDNVGTKQSDGNQSHVHEVGYSEAGGSGTDRNTVSSSGPTLATGTKGGSEARPRNVNVMMFIRFQ